MRKCFSCVRYVCLALIVCLMVAGCGQSSSPSSTPTHDPLLADQVAQIQPLAHLTDISTDRVMLAWSPDGSELAVDVGSRILFYPASDLTGKPRWISVIGLDFSMAWTPDGKSIALGDYNGNIRLLKASGSGDDMPLLTDDRFTYSGIKDIAFSLDGTLLAACTNYVRIWNLSTGETLPILEDEPHFIQQVAFSPDGKLLATGALGNWRDNTVTKIQLWDLQTGDLKRTMTGVDSWVNDLAFSPDGNQVAVSKQPFLVEVYDVTNGDLIFTLEGPTVPADFSTTTALMSNALAFSPDGKLLAAGVYGYAVQVWDAATGQPLRLLEAHTGDIVSLAFSPDGTLLASSSIDGTVRVWRIPQ